MNRKLILLPCALLLASSPAFADDVQLLGLQLPGEQADMNLASKSGNDQCGEYRIDSINLEVITSQVVTDAGTVTVLDPTKQQMALKKLALKEQTNVKVSVLDKDNKAAESLQVVLLKLKPDSDETEIVSRADTNDKGEAMFKDAVPAGNYQIGLECGAPVAAFAAPLGAAGAIGATALAIGLTRGDSSNTNSVGRTIDTPVTDPVNPPAFAPQSNNSQNSNTSHPHSSAPQGSNQDPASL